MTRADKILAFLAVATFVAFVAIVGVKVARVDLAVVIAITLCLVVYDIWTQLFPRR